MPVAYNACVDLLDRRWTGRATGPPSSPATGTVTYAELLDAVQRAAGRPGPPRRRSPSNGWPW